MSETDRKKKNKLFLYIAIALLFVTCATVVLLVFKNSVKLALETLEEEWVKEVSEEYVFE
jgi:hypothetical protein